MYKQGFEEGNTQRLIVRLKLSRLRPYRLKPGKIRLSRLRHHRLRLSRLKLSWSEAGSERSDGVNEIIFSSMCLKKTNVLYWLTINNSLSLCVSHEKQQFRHNCVAMVTSNVTSSFEKKVNTKFLSKTPNAFLWTNLENN